MTQKILVDPTKSQNRTFRVFLTVLICFAPAFHAEVPTPAATATTATTAPPDWENEAVFRINKEKPRAVKTPFDSREQALSGTSAKTSRIVSLNGDWKFHWAPTAETHPSDFFRKEFNDTGWSTLPVPSNVELHGFGTPIYTNITYPFAKNPPKVTDTPPEKYTTFKERSPVSAYRRTFTLPDSWKGQPVYLVFNGVASAARVWVNGKEVGYTQDSRTPAEFDISRFLQPGENLLAVEVHRFSDGSYLEDQDFWRLSGIFRDVYLWSDHPLHLRDWEIHPVLNEDGITGQLDATLLLRDAGSKKTPFQLELTLLDPEGKVVASAKDKGETEAGKESACKIDLGRLQVKPWSAEEPTLYTVLLQLTDPSTNESTYYSQRVGFRNVKVRNGKFLVNGKPILIKGVNRHDHNHLTGQYVTEAGMRKEMEAMKRLNINAIRTSHYPNDPRFLELADEYGFYVFSEANLETHGLGTNKGNLIANAPSWLPALLDRVANMVEAFKNHPSVIVWSLGNESGSGPNFRALSAWIKQRDPSRPIHYEGAGEADYVDFYSPMYAKVSRAEEWCRKQEKLPLEQQRPMIQCEYNHSMGNSSGGLSDYWDLIRKEPLLQGGFIWDWRDQGILRTCPMPNDASPAVLALDRQRFDADNGMLNYFAYGGDFGDVPTDGNFCMNGIMQADLRPSPQAVEVVQQYRSILTTPVSTSVQAPRVKVFNENFFTTLTGQPLLWELLEDGRVISQGRLELPTLPPQSAVEIDIPVGKVSLKPGAEVHLNVAYPLNLQRPWAKPDFIVARDQITLVDRPSTPASYTPTSPGKQLSASSENGKFILSNDKVAAVFDTSTGNLVSYKLGGRELLARPLVLNFWRPPTDNDRGSKMPQKCAVWREAAAKARLVAFNHTEAANSATVTSQWEIPAGTSRASVTYELFTDGALLISYAFDPEGKDLPVIPRIGMELSLASSFSDWTWYGRGPTENYSDRKTGSFVGIHSGRVDQLWFPYMKPQETANRTDVRWAQFSDAAGYGLRICPADGQLLEVGAYPFLPQDLEGKKYPYEIPHRQLTTVLISHRQMGLGGEDSWGATPRPAHLIQPDRRYAFSFLMEPVHP